MTKQQYIKYGGYLVFVILCLVLVFTVFKCNKIKSDYKVDMKASEEREKGYAREVEIYREWKDKEIAEGLKKDEIDKQRDYKIIIRDEKIPADVRNLSKDNLRNEVTTIKPE